MKALAPALTAAWILHATAACAGEAACWLDQGVVVVPAVVAGVAGDYILDTGAARTLLHETRAQAAGLAATELRAEVTVAGRTVTRPVVVADLDTRTVAFPTPIAGVLGVDVFEGLILDVSFEPCRVAVHDPGRAPRSGAIQVLLLRRVDGGLAARAIVTDGQRLLGGDFVLSTGQAPAVSLDPEYVEGDPKGGRLRALSFAGELQEKVGAQVSAEGPAAALGVAALRRYRLRFDLARDRLSIGQQKGPPARTDGP